MVSDVNKTGVERSNDRQRPVYRFYRWAWAGLDLVYPPSCSGCGRPGARWCLECQSGLRWLLPPVCNCCGQRLSHLERCSNGLCRACQQARPAFFAARSAADFENSLRQALHKLKYAGDVALAESLARHLIQLFLEQDWQIDLVVPVPLSKIHRAQRGYNQAALLAWPLALYCDLPYRSNGLLKARETRTQVGLGLEERHLNVAGAFRADPALVHQKSILVIDDVMTSGATLQACSEALLAAGARVVFGLTLARAVRASSDGL